MSSSCPLACSPSNSMESGSRTPSSGSGWQNSTMNSSSQSSSSLDQALMSSCPAVPPYSSGSTDRGMWRCRERRSEPCRMYCRTGQHRYSMMTDSAKTVFFSDLSSLAGSFIPCFAFKASNNVLANFSNFSHFSLQKEKSGTAAR